MSTTSGFGQGLSQLGATALLVLVCLNVQTAATETTASVAQRFASASHEAPDFRRHVVPLFGRLGCNGRACHGSFQGQGGFCLSLFGYDFKADHEALTSGTEPRARSENPSASLLLFKPTHADEHGGGQRMVVGSWQYKLLRKWIEAGVQGVKEGEANLVKLAATPREVTFSAPGERAPLKIIAHWSDGTAEDVTPLCRFQTNDESIARVDAEGVVTGLDRGDTHVIVFYDSAVAVSAAGSRRFHGSRDDAPFLGQAHFANS